MELAMIRRWLASVVLVALPVAVVPVAVTSFGGQAGAALPTAVQQCEDGGWQTLTDASGQHFQNQGQCISYLIHHPVSLGSLTGSFSGTTTWSFFNGCTFVNQVFDATYPGGSAVGAAVLHIGGCIVFESVQQFSYSGTFSITTNVGTLAGDAAGPLNNFVVGPLPPDFELTLTVVSGTGAFAGTTGTMHASILWSTFVMGVPSTYPVTGSVTIP